ncbi:MAG: recombinase family protein [Actinobacteria bacterium]|nr:recombinase family protein [Actinomycetota bacterium]
MAVYCRVSTEDQADARTIENQVDFAHRFCQLHGLDIHDFYLDDGVSGSIPVEQRPSGSRLLRDAEKGFFRVVYVYRLDRLARATLDILKTHQRLSASEVALKSMTENFDTSTPSGKFFMTTLGGIAEIERETIAERMRVGRERALREGRWPGGPPPYGYSLEGKRLVVNEKEAGIVRMIFYLYTGGEMSTASIAHYINAMGVSSPAGSGKKGPGAARGWHASRVWSILSNPVYRGTFLYGRRGGKKVVGIECPPVVTAGDWEAAGEARRRNSQCAGRNCRREYILKGLVRCGLCGGRFYGDGSGREGRLCYYRCSKNTSLKGSAGKCPAKSVRADIIEEMIWEDVCSFVLTAGPALEKIEEALPARWGKLPLEDQLARLEKIMHDKEAERKRIIGLYRQGIISGEDVKVQLDIIGLEIESVKNRKSLLVRRSGMPGQFSDRPEAVRKRLQWASPAEKRELIRGLVEGITVGLSSLGDRPAPIVTVRYLFGGFTDCSLRVETRGKYRLGVPKSRY